MITTSRFPRVTYSPRLGYPFGKVADDSDYGPIYEEDKNHAYSRVRGTMSAATESIVAGARRGFGFDSSTVS